MTSSCRMLHAGYHALPPNARQQKTSIFFLDPARAPCDIRQRRNMAAKNKGIARKRKDERRAEGEARQAAYDKLTNREKLARMNAAGHHALRQRLKIARAIEAEIRAS